jgi:hypothetical protein
VRQHARLGRGIGEQIQVRCAEQQRLHSDDANAALFPHAPNGIDFSIRGFGNIWEVFARCDINRRESHFVEELRDLLIEPDIPSNI